jgi:hypothetical protein
MNTIELLKQASDFEKKACSEFITGFTQSGIMSLVKGGVAFEKAAEMIKQACETNPTLISHMTNMTAFEKAAEYIGELEVKLDEMTKVAGEATIAVQAADEKNPLNKLASVGFTKEEIEMMSQLPENLIEKVASNNSKPWDMGNAVGMSRENTDALLEFLCN